MFKDKDKKKRFIYYASFLGIFLFFFWGGLMEYYRVNNPTVPDQPTGRIYPKNYHGQIVYLNLYEEILIYALPGSGFLVLIALGLISLYPRRSLKP